jgi:hypothetical protein
MAGIERASSSAKNWMIETPDQISADSNACIANPKERKISLLLPENTPRLRLVPLLLAGGLLR